MEQIFIADFEKYKEEKELFLNSNGLYEFPDGRILNYVGSSPPPPVIADQKENNVPITLKPPIKTVVLKPPNPIRLINSTSLKPGSILSFRKPTPTSTPPSTPTPTSNQQVETPATKETSDDQQNNNAPITLKPPVKTVVLKPSNTIRLINSTVLKPGSIISYRKPTPKITPASTPTPTSNQQVETPATQETSGPHSPVFLEQKNVATRQKKTHWTNSAILALLDVYTKNQADFKSNSMPRIDAWIKVTEELSQRGFHYSPTVCCDKFKALKRQYVMKKDNMGARSSGARFMAFEYFEEMDAIFSKSPAIAPRYLEASIDEVSTDELVVQNRAQNHRPFSEFSQYDDVPVEELDRMFPILPPTKKKRQSDKMNLLSMLEKREENTEKFRQALLTKFDEQMKSHNDIMKSLIEKL